MPEESFFDDPDDNFTIEDEIKPARSSLSAAFQPGEIVRHRTFGIGVVVEISEMGSDFRITVDFQSCGKKSLIQSYAKLARA